MNNLIDVEFQNAIESLNHAIYSQEELIFILTNLQVKVGERVETMIQEVKDIKTDESVLDNEVLYKECKNVIKEILSETFEDQDNYKISIVGQDNRVEVEFLSDKTLGQLAEEILDELNEII